MLEKIPTEIFTNLITALVTVVGSWFAFRGKKGESDKGMQEIANDSIESSFKRLEAQNNHLMAELNKAKMDGSNTVETMDELREQVMRLRMDIIAFASIAKTIELSARQLPRLFRQLSPEEFEEYLYEHQKLISDLIQEIVKDMSM